MKTKNWYWIIAGMINLFTAMLHSFGGQLSLVDPMLGSSLDPQVVAELLGVWHMVTIVLFTSTGLMLFAGFKGITSQFDSAIKLLGSLYVLFALVFISVSLARGVFAPQWILLLPIGLLAIVGNRKTSVVQS